jgi:hypothetical protein
MIDLLTNLHANDKYSRIVVVADSLGGFIGYDQPDPSWDETDRRQDPAVEFTT